MVPLRFQTFLIRLGFLFCVASFAFSVSWLLDRVRQSERFALKRVEIERTMKLSSSLSDEVVGRLASLAGLEQGENLFAFDLTAVARQIEAHPNVRRAKVYRKLPSTVVIQVEEHRPFGLVAIGQTYLADREGRLIKSVEPRDPLSGPLVTGLDRDAVNEGRSRLVRVAFDMVQAWREAGLPEVSEVHIPEAGLEKPRLVVRVTEGWSVELDDVKQLQRLKRTLREADNRGLRIDSVRFGRDPRRVAVALREGAP